MKIFVSYSRRDAGDFAEVIQRHFRSFKYDFFTDEKSIYAEDTRSNITSCDVFVAIVTYGALQSQHVENEVLQAQRENKIIIPCFHRDVNKNEIKWDLGRLQGIEFEEKYELARKLYSMITRIQKNSGKRQGGTSLETKEDSTGKGASKSKEATPPNYTYTPKYKEHDPITESKKVRGIKFKNSNTNSGSGRCRFYNCICHFWFISPDKLPEPTPTPEPKQTLQYSLVRVGFCRFRSRTIQGPV